MRLESSPDVTLLSMSGSVDGDSSAGLLGPTDTTVRRALEDDTADAVTDAAVREALFGVKSPPTVVGRFVTLEVLGRGSFGTVYLAYDTRLDRRVALKVLATRGRGENMALLREARALAQLEHPNVVTVFDAFEAPDGRPAIAMAYVQGVTAHEWLLEYERPRTLREIIGVFAQAAEGMAAAHCAGIVHRDFKPSNMMVAADGTVRVTDFGLAEPSSESAERPDELIVGTPMFLPPEAFEGKAPGAAGDMYAFGVALYWAVQRERPFSQSAIGALALAKRRGALALPPGHPRWLRALVSRATDPDASARPTFDAIRGELARRRSRPRWHVVVAALGIGAGAAAAVLGSDRDRCAEIAATFERSWGPERRAAIRSAFRTDARSYSEDALTRVEAELDDRGARWIALRTAACVAARKGTGADATEASVRTSCLEGQLLRLEGITRMLAEADQAMVERAVAVLDELPAPEQCEDATADRTPPPIPEDPATQERVEALRTGARDVRNLSDLEHVDEATRLGEELLETAREIGFSPLVGEVAVALGGCYIQRGRYDEALPLFEEAALIGRRERLEEVARGAVRGLVHLHTVYTRRHDLAEWLHRDWEASLGGGGERPWAHADLAKARAHLARARGRTADEAVAAETAVELLEAAGDEGVVLVGAMVLLAQAYVSLDRLDDALGVLARARVVTDDVVGPTHPLHADLLTLTGQIRAAQHRHDESVAVFQRALEIVEGAYGDANPRTAGALNDVGVVLESVGRTDEALAALRRARRIQRESGAADHVLADTIASNLGNLLRRQGHAQEAVPLHRAVLAARLRTGDVDGESVLLIRDLLADDLRALDRCAEAEPEYRAAIEGRERARGPLVAEIAHPLVGLGLCRLRGGDLAGAQAALDRALTLVDADPDQRDTAGIGHFALAMILRRAGRPAATVDHHVARARAHLGTDPRSAAVLLATLERFAAGDDLVDLVY